MIRVFESYNSHHLKKAFESLFGCVTCLPGCLTMYRIITDDGSPLLPGDGILYEYWRNDVKMLHEKNLYHLGVGLVGANGARRLGGEGMPDSLQLRDVDIERQLPPGAHFAGGRVGGAVRRPVLLLLLRTAESKPSPLAGLLLLLPTVPSTSPSSATTVAEPNASSHALVSWYFL